MTEDGEFEVGDWVRCIEEPRDGEYSLELGAIFQVKDTVYRDSRYSVLRRTFGEDECFRAILFEIIQPFGTHRLLKRGGMHAGQKDL